MDNNYNELNELKIDDKIEIHLKNGTVYTGFYYIGRVLLNKKDKKNQYMIKSLIISNKPAERALLNKKEDVVYIEIEDIDTIYIED